MPMIVVKMTEGRTKDQKKAIMKGITEVVAREANCPPEVVSVLIDDQYSLDEWSVGGKTWTEILEEKK